MPLFRDSTIRVHPFMVFGVTCVIVSLGVGFMYATYPLIILDDVVLVVF
jgi:hypothetical protein